MVPLEVPKAMSWLDCLTAGGPVSSDRTLAALASIRRNFGLGFLIGGDCAGQHVDVSRTVVGEWAAEVDLTSSDRRQVGRQRSARKSTPRRTVSEIIIVQPFTKGSSRMIAHEESPSGSGRLENTLNQHKREARTDLRT
jgi:hypothetical protein